jgi:two-component system sensor histidine kinase UhpB
MLAREAEKKRLAASLHDAIGAMQVGLSSALLVVAEEVRLGESRRALASIQRAQKLLRKMTSAVKGACVESWPPALAVSGLDAVLRELLSGFAGRSKIRVVSDIRLPEEEPQRENPLAIVLYRLAQEALMNAEKHSGAKKLEFSVGSENGWLKLSVRDDGRGFDMVRAKNKKASLGLKIMAEAAAAAGGYFSVYSRPGGGTLVKADLPLDRAPGTAL